MVNVRSVLRPGYAGKASRAGGNPSYQEDGELIGDSCDAKIYSSMGSMDPMIASRRNVHLRSESSYSSIFTYQYMIYTL